MVTVETVEGTVATMTMAIEGLQDVLHIEVAESETILLGAHHMGEGQEGIGQGHILLIAVLKGTMLVVDRTLRHGSVIFSS